MHTILILEIIFALLGFFLGGALASGVSCLIARKKAGESWVKSVRSHCDACGHILSWVDLIPVFGYILRKGKCKYCGQHIPKTSFFCELICGIAFMVGAVLTMHNLLAL